MTTPTIDPVVVTFAGPIETAPAKVTECGFLPATQVSTTAVGNASPLLPHSPKRERATLTFAGTAAGDSCLLCASLGDAQRGQGALIVTDTSKTHAPLILITTGEVWLAAVTGTVTVGVLSEVRAMS